MVLATEKIVAIGQIRDWLGYPVVYLMWSLHMGVYRFCESQLSYSRGAPFLQLRVDILVDFKFRALQ